MFNVISSCKQIKEIDPEAVYDSLRGKNTYLLESAEGGEKVARFSFIGFNPAAKIIVKKKAIEFEAFDPALNNLKPKGKDPLDVMRNVILQFKLRNKPVSRFFGGFVGYFSYDLVRHFYDLGGANRDDLKEPSCEFILAKNNIIFDHKKKKTYFISHQFTESRASARDEVQGKMNFIHRPGPHNVIYSKPSIPEIKYRAEGEAIDENFANEFIANISERKFKEKVRKAKKYILAGDIFQVVISRRLETNFNGDEFEVYGNLKRINPSSYMYYLDFGSRKIVGSSPEMLIRVENRKVETYPIAGTRMRGKNPAQDKKFEKEMKEDEKEKAEHVMLVDLGRNDIGRVAKFGSVKVKKFMAVEKYSHVQHLVSEVEGELKEGEDEFSAFKSVFPAGTVSGAPKVRAMEIIEELEPSRRDVYAGAVGYFSFTRNLDCAIAIRTIVFEKNRAYVQTGAGIVADSDPEKEYQEAMDKAEAMIKALNGR